MRRSGISNVLAAIVLAIVAVFLVVLVASIGATNIGKTASGNPSVSVNVDALRVSQNSYALSVDITNIGDTNVRITRIEVKDGANTVCRIDLSKELKPSQTHHLSFVCSLYPKKYVLLVKGGELSWEFPLNII